MRWWQRGSSIGTTGSRVGLGCRLQRYILLVVNINTVVLEVLASGAGKTAATYINQILSKSSIERYQL